MFRRTYIDDDGTQQSLAVNTIKDTDAFIAEVAKHNDLLEIRISDANLNDADAAQLAKAIAKNPKLQTLDLNSNFIGPAGVEALTEAMDGNQLTKLNLAHNMLKGEEGAQAVDALVKKSPRLQHLNVSRNLFKDEGAEVLTQTLADAPQLYYLEAAQLNISTPMFEGLIDAISGHPSLCKVNIMLDERAMTTDAEFEESINRLDGGDCPNLTFFLPLSNAISAMCTRNKQNLSEAAHHLEEAPDALDYDQLCKVARYWRGINLNINNIEPPLDTSEKSLETMLDEFPKFLTQLPELPSKRGADALFTPDANGYAPLDNPRLWQNPKAVMEFLADSGQALDEAFLARETPRGVNFVQSALGIAPISLVLPLLNEAGVKLQGDALLDGEQNPTPLYTQLLDRGTAGKLFTTENWQGESPDALAACAKHLPVHISERLPLHALSHSIRSAHTQGHGYGR